MKLCQSTNSLKFEDTDLSIEAREKEWTPEKKRRARTHLKARGVKEKGLCGGDILYFENGRDYRRSTLSFCFEAPNGAIYGLTTGHVAAEVGVFVYAIENDVLEADDSCNIFRIGVVVEKSSNPDCLIFRLYRGIKVIPMQIFQSHTVHRPIKLPTGLDERPKMESEIILFAGRRRGAVGQVIKNPRSEPKYQQDHQSFHRLASAVAK